MAGGQGTTPRRKPPTPFPNTRVYICLNYGQTEAACPHTKAGEGGDPPPVGGPAVSLTGVKHP